MNNDYKAGYDNLARPPGGNYTDFNQGKNDRALQDQSDRQRQQDSFSSIPPPSVHHSGGTIDLKNGAGLIIAIGVGVLIFGGTHRGGNASLDGFMSGLFAIIGLIVIVTGVIGLVLRNSDR